MTKKTISISPKPQSLPKEQSAVLDKWVSEGTINNNEPPFIKKKSTKRLTVVISEELHKKIKLYCVKNNMNMLDKVEKILEKEFSDLVL